MKPRFYLSSKQNKEGRSTVLLFLSYGGTRIVISSGKIIKPENWNAVKQCAKGMNADSLEFNNDLLSFASKAITILKELVANKESDVLNKLKARLKDTISEEKEIVKKIVIGNNGTFLDFIIDYEKLAPKSAATRGQYLSTLYLLQEYQKKVYKLSIDFEVIDLKFYNSFIKFCQEEKKYATNTIGKYIKNIKFLMGYAEEEGLHSNMIFKSKRFKKPVEESFSISLSEEELNQLYTHDFSQSLRKEKARDLFLVNNWIGVRIGDLLSISKGNIHNHSISIRAEKTNEFVEIPLHPIAKKILEKYNGQLPNDFTEQEYNALLKDISLEAGFNEELAYSITKGGKRMNITKKKFQMISAHTARRSFATNLYKRGLPVQTIMAVTGHETEKSFRKYIKSKRIDAVKNLNNFFDNLS